MNELSDAFLLYFLCFDMQKIGFCHSTDFWFNVYSLLSVPFTWVPNNNHKPRANAIFI
jgi:hypothetical protein